MSPIQSVPSLSYKGELLYCEDVSLGALADKFGTPLYVYSKKELSSAATAYLEASANLPGSILVSYAVKANGNLSILKLLSSLGLGADVTSGGELYLALRAGFHPQNILFSGVGKTDKEIKFAIESKIKAVHVESEEEYELVAGLSKKIDATCPVAIRVNPNVAVSTHSHIRTGLLIHKFGVPPFVALDLVSRASRDKHVEIRGLALHLGSQITNLEPYVVAMKMLLELAGEARSRASELRYLDMGGGLGVDYGSTDAPQVSDFVGLFSPVLEAGYELVLEPGRSIVAAAGTLLTTLLYKKQTKDRRFLIADAGMNDLLRPALYNATHPILPVKRTRTSSQDEIIVYELVGPVCESGDTIASHLRLPMLDRGDRLAIAMAGAYGFAMSSNYNGRLRPAEVLITGAEANLIRRRQEVTDLVADFI